MSRIAVALLLAALLSGCGHMFDADAPGTAEGDYGHGSPGELGPLLERRDAEQVLADRDRMISEITAALAREVPGSQWLPKRSPTTSPCGDFGSTDGRVYFGQSYVSTTPVPAALWPTASQTVVDIAARYGYTDVVSRTEDPSDDRATNLDIEDADGGRLSFGSMNGATVSVNTGCYLTAQDKRKAREAAPPA